MNNKDVGVAVRFERNVYRALIGALVALIAVFSGTGYADDTDLFDLSAATEPAKIMLVVDTSGSMAWLEGAELRSASYTDDCTGTDSEEQLQVDGTYVDVTVSNSLRKICIVKSVLLPFLDPALGDADTTWSDNYQVGLAKYGAPGAIVVVPVGRLGSINDADSNRNRLINAVSNLTAVGSTPLIGSFLEVAEYLTGGQAVSSDSIAESDSSVWVGGSSLAETYTGVDLGPQCQSENNHLIFLTDGASSCEKGSAFQRLERGNCTTSITDLLDDSTLGIRINEFIHPNDPDQINKYDTANCGPNAFSNYEEYADMDSFDYTSYWGCLSVMSHALYDPPDAARQSHSVKTHIVAYDLDDASALNEDGTLPATASETTAGLYNWASSGGGQYIAASNSSELESALKDLDGEISLAGSFVVASGGVGVNQLNRFVHLDEMYFSMFTPSNKPFWYGNLKKYFFQIGDEGEFELYTDEDKTTLAVEDGVFRPGVLTEWSEDLLPAFYNTNTMQTVDGAIAHIGGAASQIEQPTTRKLFVYYEGARYQLFEDDAGVSGEDIDDLRTELSNDYSSLLADPEGVDAGALASYNTDLLAPSLDWLLGKDVNDEWLRISQHQDPDERPESPVDMRVDDNDLRNFYGAPLHSSPLFVNYLSRNDDGDPLDDPEDVVFLSTNDGKLYAVDTDTGEEHLAYMPEAMIKRPALDEMSPVERMYNATKPTAADGDLIYGLDSTWTVWRQDVDRNGNIDEDTNDFVYLYGGMRRGGRNYYILNATEVQDSEEITEEAVIEGGAGQFINNGQSWSEPRLAIINYAGTPAAVFIVGGGYDTAYDNGRPATLPAKGAQVYIISARDFTEQGSGTLHSAGDVLWWASAASNDADSSHTQISALQHSIPSTVKLLDVDGDGYLDHFYVGDMGGQVHRFDINNANTGAANLISNPTDTVIAQLGFATNGLVSIADEDDRRFFYPPSVAKMQCPQGFCMVVSIGSGWRSNPTDVTINEKFYMLMDYEPFSGDRPILTDTSTVTGDGTTPEILALTRTADVNALTQATYNSGRRGYSLELGGTGFEAEKLLGSSLIVDGVAYFSTYYRPPANSSSQVCQLGEGASAVYAVRFGDAQARTLSTGLSQNVAGSLQALISEVVPPTGEGGEGDDGDETETGGRGVNAGIVSGTGSVGNLDLDLNAIRKTSWYEIQ